MKITKEQVLANLSEVKKFIEEVETKVEEKVVGLAIKNRWTGEVIFQSTKTTYKEAVLERLESDVDLSNANLHGANLHGADLSGVNLSNADLSGVNLSNADLSGADLSDADLRDADLSNADLSGADLSGADLRDAEMQNVTFYGRGGTKPLKRLQLDSFLGALGFIIED